MERASKRKLIFAAGVGNFLEFFDFGIYAVFAIIIGELFFPSDDPAVSLLISVSVFGVGFLMRPLGGIILGSYADRHCRKAAMLITITFMALGSALIAFTPPYAAIGLLAPVLIIAGRLLQGFSAGGEIGAATALLVESAQAGEKGSFVRWQYITQALASMTGSAFGAFLFWALPKEDLYSWGWRIPFIFALLIIPVGLYIRKHIHDTYQAPRFPKESAHPFIKILTTAPRQFIAATGTVMPFTILLYVVLKYMPLYLQQVTAITPWIIYLTTMGAYAIQAAGSFTGGRIYDTMERGKWLVIGIIGICAILVSAMFASVTMPVMFFACMFATAFLMGMASPVSAAFILEAFPPEIRTTAMSASYSIGVALFGGTAQMIVTKLLAASGGNPIAPLWYLLPALIAGAGFYVLFQEKPQKVAT